MKIVRYVRRHPRRKRFHSRAASGWSSVPVAARLVKPEEQACAAASSCLPGMHVSLNLLGGSAARDFQFVSGLEIQPELCRAAEVTRQA